MFQASIRSSGAIMLDIEGNLDGWVNDTYFRGEYSCNVFLCFSVICWANPLEDNTIVRVTGTAAILKPSSKDYVFKISYEPSEGYLKVRLSERPNPCQRCRHTEIRAEIRGEEVHITSFSTRIS